MISDCQLYRLNSLFQFVVIRNRLFNFLLFWLKDILLQVFRLTLKFADKRVHDFCGWLNMTIRKRLLCKRGVQFTKLVVRRVFLLFKLITAIQFCLIFLLQWNISDYFFQNQEKLFQSLESDTSAFPDFPGTQDLPPFDRLWMCLYTRLGKSTINLQALIKGVP